jgi:hypothetical protein
MAVTHETTNVTPIAPAFDTNINVPGLWHVRPIDGDRITNLLKYAWRVDEIWDDEARANPGLWFMQQYTHPSNLLFDVLNGKGMVAFIRTIPNWRAQVYAAAWHRDAMRRDDLFIAACKIAMLTHNLIVIDSFVKLSNPLSQRATLRCGFKKRGIIKDAQCYNGTPRPMYWNEAERATFELDEVT